MAPGTARQVPRRKWPHRGRGRAARINRRSQAWCETKWKSAGPLRYNPYMARGHLACGAVALIASLWAACGDTEKASQQAASTSGSNAGASGDRCERLAKLCGDKAKHVEKIAAACTQATQEQAERGCGDQQLAVYDCFEKQLCMTLNDKVWSMKDLGVLADRHEKCAAERAALAACAKN